MCHGFSTRRQGLQRKCLNSFHFSSACIISSPMIDSQVRGIFAIGGRISSAITQRSSPGRPPISNRRGSDTFCTWIAQVAGYSPPNHNARPFSHFARSVSAANHRRVCSCMQDIPAKSLQRGRPSSGRRGPYVMSILGAIAIGS